ncbi:dipeptide ABC transporter ATP-binding protein [Candidatus Spongiisocius sp.]|uniref:ABC transporter ATP-binding protein n=1 Tax=Candidatus Spongiisocius sp. TaxID=3101273 RepID=UPI003B5C0011
MTTATAAGSRRPSRDAAAGANLLDIENLAVRFDLPTETIRAVSGVSLTVAPSETFALVGESGSGKSVSMLSVMGLLPSPPATVSGSVRLEGREIIGMPGRELRRFRGREVAMVFQEPMSSLNPVHRVGRQIGESLRIHRGFTKAEARRRAIELLDRVGIPSAAARVDDYPHEFSGGMRQRAMIAMALACEPKLLIADEPTTALDVTVQAQIVDLVREVQDEYRLAVVWITHDLGVVAEIADRVAVMYAGRLAEMGDAHEIYRSTRHPYTSGLLRSIPRLDLPVTTRLAEIPGSPLRVAEQLRGCPFDARCPLVGEGCSETLPELEEVGPGRHGSACIHHHEMDDAPNLWSEGFVPEEHAAPGQDGDVVVSVRGLRVHFPVFRGLGRSRSIAIRAVDGVDLDVRRGRTLGVVGESGCGKTTLGRALVALVRPTAGTIEINGDPIDHRSGRHRRVVQMIFQDPFSAMNPGMRVGDVIAEPLRIHRLGTADEIRERVSGLLAQVGLPTDAGRRHPHEFSGGQRQRIAVARALAADPEVIVCDEPVSSLDVSVQAQVVNLLADIQAATGMAFVFIAHDLAVVRHVSHEVAVMYLGEIVERAPRDRIYEAPLHPYTKALLAAVPAPEPGVRSTRSAKLEGDLPSPADPPSGCRFHTRCPVAVEGLCSAVKPELVEVAPGRWVSCHLAVGPG